MSNKKCIHCGGKHYKNNRCRECHNEYYREYIAKNRERIREQKLKSRLKIYHSNPMQRWKDHCNWKIRNAHLESQPCKCGESHTEAHHDSYMPDDIFKIRWLCIKCHNRWHRKHKPKLPTLKQIEKYGKKTSHHRDSKNTVS